MSNNLECKLGGKTEGTHDDSNLRLYQDNDESGRDSKVGSAQSSVDKASTQPETNSDITSDEGKQLSTQTEDEDDRRISNVDRKPSASHKKKDVPSKAESFTTQLMDMLNNEADSSDGLKWLPDGNGFVINQRVFEEELLPRYFNSPCTMQSFMRRLYRWGFKQSAKSTTGSGRYVFTNEGFHRDNDMYMKMKPLPRRKNKSGETFQDIRQQQMSFTATQGPLGIQSWSDRNLASASYQGAQFEAISSATNAPLTTSPSPASYQGAQFEAISSATNAPSTTSPSPIAQGSGQLIANEHVPILPPHLASAQGELMSLVSTITSTYSASPVLLSSLQNELANILQGVPPTQFNSVQQQIPSLNTTTSQTAPTSNQEPVTSIVDNLMQFLTQGQRAFVPPPLSGQPPTNTMNTMMQPQNVMAPAPAFVPNAIQGYNPQIQPYIPNNLLTGPNLQFLSANQGVPPYGVTPMGLNAENADTTTTSSSNDPEASDTSISNLTGDTSSARAKSSSDDQVVPPRSFRKRGRSPSTDR